MARNRQVPKPWGKTTKAQYPNGWPSNMRAVLYLNERNKAWPAGDSPEPPDPFGPEIAPEINFVDWWYSTYSAGEITENTFSNIGTLALIGGTTAEIGETYRVVIETSRDAGTLRAYFTDSYSVNQQEGAVEIPTGAGTYEFDIVAAGSNFSFRISIQNTTTTVTSLSIKKILNPSTD